MPLRLALGLDSSTQGLMAVLADIDTHDVVYRKSLDYFLDPRLNKFGITSDYILPPSEAGEANQPPMMYFTSLDAIFSDMAGELPAKNLSIADIAVINVSAQQHGHVFLNAAAETKFTLLRNAYASDLVKLLDGVFSVPFTRIWRTSCTADEADFVRRESGGKEQLIRLSGSDAPLRFSAFGIRKTALEFPDAYRDTALIQQISSLVPGVLIGRACVPLDYGNACGASLMDYTAKQWSPALLDAVAEGLPDAGGGLALRLPALASGSTIVGDIARYFVEKYGFSPHCAIAIGSGDNPQTKVLVPGTLLSLGSSFVLMIPTGGKTFDMTGNANAMYDALDRPFMFGCRTNGTLRWDAVRAQYGLAKSDYARAEEALRNTPPGNHGRIFIWQSEAESFPASKPAGPVRIGYETGDFAADYAGIVESSLAAVYLHSRAFTPEGGEMHVTGGPANSPEILRRLAAIWNRPVITLESTGAALGAAVSGAYAFLKSNGSPPDAAAYASSFLRKGALVTPTPADVAAYHGSSGLLSKYAAAEARILA